MNDYISKTGHLSKHDLIKESTKKNIPASGGENRFGRILSEQLGPKQTGSEQISSEQPGDILSAQGLKQPSALSEIQIPFNIAFTETSFNTEQYVKRLETSLDLLETYAAVLNDPDKTLKQASRLLDQVLDQIQGLEQELKTSGTLDSDLNQILTQMLTAASLERIKMDRGDYLN